jgi:hypothetical protein
MVINFKLKKTCLILNTLRIIAKELSESIVSWPNFGMGTSKMRKILWDKCFALYLFRTVSGRSGGLLI